MIISKQRKRLGDMLIESGVITSEQLTEALNKQRGTGKLLGEILIDDSIATEDDILNAIQNQLGICRVNLLDNFIEDNVLNIIRDVSFLKRNVCFPYSLEGSTFKLAMADPLNTSTLDDVSIITGLKTVPVVTTQHDIFTAIDKYYGSEQIKDLMNQFDTSDFDSDVGEVTVEKDPDAPMVKLVNVMFEQAVHMGASDIHIEPLEGYVRVRYRVDGDLIEQTNHYPSVFLSGIVSRIKIIGGMDIAEKRRPQDGRITIKVDGVEFDIRVSILPTSFGEKIVMRLTNKSKLTMDKKLLGLQPEDEVKFDDLLSNSHGIILVTGPTGSGKSTTLYTALSELNKEKVNICTIEDPVEANIDGLNQVQVNNKAGLTFPSALRCFLRQDPDIIMVGEIRDTETASLAIDASLTGHLVVSTLHTNSSVSSISRLEKMGVEPYLLADAVVGILAQRLVKRLCTCKKSKFPSIRDRKKLGISEEDSDIVVYEPVGCDRCNHTGYKGRIAVYEILVFTDELRDAIAEERPIAEIESLALSQGLTTLKASGIKLVKQGITSVSELDRIVHEVKLED